MKAILSPCLFFNPQNLNKQQIQENTDFLSDTLNFIYNYLDLDLDKYDNSPYDERKWYEPNFEYEKLDFDSLTVNVYPILLKLLYRKYNHVDLSNYTNENIIDNNFVDLSEDKTDFLKYLNYIRLNEPHGIVFIGNSQKSKTVDTIDTIKYNNQIICENNFSLPVIRDLYLTESDAFNSVITVFDTEYYFPRRDLCCKFEQAIREYEKRKALSHDDRIALYKKYFEIIAQRNNLHYSKEISKRFGFKRKYFTNDLETHIFSVDTESGGIEVFTGVNYRDHLGQHYFNCICDKTEKKKNKKTHTPYT